MADQQQRSVIVTAIILALILGGALVWLLNRTPANQLATQALQDETADQAQAENDQAAAQELITVDQNSQLAQAGTPATTPLSPTGGEVQGVAATAPTGPAEMGLLASFAAIALGSGGLLSLGLSRLQRLGG